jgi:predicted transcriptional regulator
MPIFRAKRVLRMDDRKGPQFMADISEAQKVLLKHILVNGPSSASDVPNLTSSTAQASMKRLVEIGLVQFERQEVLKTGVPKKYFALTMGGFCYGFDRLSIDEKTTFADINSAITKWQHLCPEILGKWEYMISEEKNGCKLRDDYQKSPYDDEPMVRPGATYFHLPYEVPTKEANYWIVYLSDICYDIAKLWRLTRDLAQLSKYATKEEFIRIFAKNIVEEIIVGPTYWDIQYTVCVVMNIPEVRDIIRSELPNWKNEFEWRSKMIEGILSI